MNTFAGINFTNHGINITPINRNRAEFFLDVGMTDFIIEISM